MIRSIVYLLILLFAAQNNVFGQNIGEIVKLQDSEWVVLSAKNLGSKAKSNYLYVDDATSEGKFILVHYQVNNTSKKTDQIFITPVLIDSEQREFTDFLNQDFYFPNGGKSITAEQLPPGIPKKFYAMYELPISSKSIRFRTRSLSVSPEYKEVNLSLP